MQTSDPDFRTTNITVVPLQIKVLKFNNKLKFHYPSAFLYNGTELTVVIRSSSEAAYQALAQPTAELTW